MIFHHNATKTGFSAHKGQKGQIVESPIITSFFGRNPFQLIKDELIFIENCSYEIFFYQNSKAKAMRPLLTMKAGLQGQTFFVVFLSIGPEGS